jgi:hypothetical protein
VRIIAQSALTTSLAAALLVGCGGAQPSIGASGMIPESHAGTQPRVMVDRIRTAQSSYQVLYSFANTPMAEPRKGASST